MSLEQVTELFKWMTIIGVGTMALGSVLIMVFRKTVCRMHGRLFGITEEQVAVACYGYLGVFKVLVIMLNIVPYVALLIVQR